MCDGRAGGGAPPSGLTERSSKYVVGGRGKAPLQRKVHCQSRDEARAPGPEARRVATEPLLPPLLLFFIL